MNLHALVAGTVGLWQFQGNLKDSGGGGLDLATINAFTNAPGGTEQYATVDTCTQAFKYDGSTKLLVPLSTALQLPGAMTVEFLLFQTTTAEQAYLTCADPAGRSGGAGADRIGSLYTLFYNSTAHPSIADKNIGSNLPSVGYGDFTGTVNADFQNVYRHVAFTRSGTFLWKFFLNGVKKSTVQASLNTATGVEQCYIGGYEGGGENMGTNALMWSMRVLNVERSEADIAADAAYTTSACGSGGGGGGNAGTGGGGGTSGGSQASAASTGLVYDAVAAAQFGIALRQNPRS